MPSIYKLAVEVDVLFYNHWWTRFLNLIDLYTKLQRIIDLNKFRIAYT